MRGNRLLGATLSLVCLWFVACGGPQYVSDACRDDYDECINACACECEDTTIVTGPASLNDENETFFPASYYGKFNVKPTLTRL